MMCFKSLEIVHMGPCHTYLSKHFIIPHTYSLTLILFMFTSIQTRHFIIVISAINFSVHREKNISLNT